MDALVCRIEVCFSDHDTFLRPFEAHDCNHVEYPEEAESIEARL